MSGVSATANIPAHAPRLVRDPADTIVAGVCAAFARWLGIDAILVRVGFAIVAVASFGMALVAYAIAWVAIPAVGDESAGAVEAAPRRRILKASWRVAGGVALLTLSLLLILRELGIWWSDAVMWPLILATTGAALLWRQQNKNVPPNTNVPSASPRTNVPSTSSASPAGVAGSAGGTAVAVGEVAAPPTPRSRIAELYRGGFGVALVVGAVLIFLSANDVLGDTREVLFTVIAATAGLALILAPFLWRLGRNLASERAERIRSQERAELAAHLHDSVLQTLTLVQKRSGDPREVAQLARRQERELRSWLFDAERAPASDSLAAALELAAAEVEDAHGVPIEVVAVGDMAIDERAEAIAAAAREAMVNAAKFAPDAGEVAVYAELAPDRAQVFVRDRGPGFDPDGVPADRRGLRESIVGRMERFGGRADVRSSPGAGTEVALTIGEPG